MYAIEMSMEPDRSRIVPFFHWSRIIRTVAWCWIGPGLTLYRLGYIISPFENTFISA